MPSAPATPAQRSYRRARFIEISRPQKVIDPTGGFTKSDIADYYRKVAKRLLPFLKDRPVMLERVPDGLGEGRAHYWQKNTPDNYADWIPRVELTTEQGKPANYVLVNDIATLLYVINKGALTFHPWLSRLGSLDRPDFVVFNLDVGEARFADAVVVAKRLYDVLIDESKPSFVKTSGQSGLHVVLPWWQSGGFEESRRWAAEIAGQVVESMPHRATTEFRKSSRGSRVYIDISQNVRGRHAVPPYVLRALPGLPVSTPLRWADLTENLDPKFFNIRSVPLRIARQKLDPMSAILNRKRGAMGSRRRVG